MSLNRYKFPFDILRKVTQQLSGKASLSLALSTRVLIYCRDEIRLFSGEFLMLAISTFPVGRCYVYHGVKRDKQRKRAGVTSGQPLRAMHLHFADNDAVEDLALCLCPFGVRCTELESSDDAFYCVSLSFSRDAINPKMTSTNSQRVLFAPQNSHGCLIGRLGEP